MNSYNHVIIKHDLDLSTQNLNSICRKIYRYILAQWDLISNTSCESEVFFPYNDELGKATFATYDNRLDETKTTEKIQLMNTFFEEHPLIIADHVFNILITPDLYEDISDIGDQTK